MKFKLAISLIVLFVALSSCKEKDKDKNNNDTPFDTKLMLSNVSNQYIIPAYANYATQATQLKQNVEDFVSAPTLAGLATCKTAWLNLALAWQDVAFIEFGPAEKISLRQQTNVYPVDISLIESNILGGTYNLELPSNFKAKGIQAIDYLLYNKSTKTEQEIVADYTASTSLKNYLKDVVVEIESNASKMSSEWVTYKSIFIANSESNAQGSAVSDMVNSLSLHYEAYVRKGKIGIPSGVFNGFSQTPMPNHVEALYGGKSIELAKREIYALSTFFNGNDYVTGKTGSGFDDYLSNLGTESGSLSLTVAINNQFTAITSGLNGLNSPLSESVTQNQTAVKAIYQEMQKLVPMIKIELTSAIGVQITYQDSDGD